MLQVSAARLVTTDWASHLYFAETLAGMGTILGLALGASRFRRRGLIWLTFLYTLVVVPWQFSSASDHKLLLDRLGETGRILGVSFGQFMARQPVKDPLFFVAFVALVFWLLCILAGFAVARDGNILVGIIPAGVITLVIQIYANYQRHGSWWLGFYLLFALLLVGRHYYLENREVWHERRVYVHDEAWSNILGGLFTVVAASIFVAWTFPTSISSVRGAGDAWSRMTRSIRDRLSNAVTSLNGPNARPGLNFYGASLGLGQDAAVGDSTVLQVKVLTLPDSNPRYYWRARVYDAYRGGQWSASVSNTLEFQPPANAIAVPNAEDQSLAQFLFTLQFPAQSLIYAPAEPVWIDKPATVQITPIRDGLNDVLVWQAKKAFPNGGQYQVRSEISDPNVEQLRAAPPIYPQWVQQRYLEVPSNVLAPIQALARKVTEGRDTPYDKAQAITNYLRSNITYSTTLPPVPEGRDPVEWVLFDYKKGFCNYYASAEVLMLRSVGVPARLAVGFAQGEYVNGTYVVRRRDAHAWPEVFFPGLGWVEFEPTTSQDALVRLDPALRANSPSVGRGPLARPDDDPSGRTPNAGKPVVKPAVPFSKTPAGRALPYVVSLIAAAFAAFLVYRYRMISRMPAALDHAFMRAGMTTPRWITGWLHWNRLDAVEQAFAPVNWSLRWFGKTPPVHASHVERAATLKKLMPLAVKPIDAAASELETGLFTPHAPDVRRARRAGWSILVHYVQARLRGFLGI
jgi:transglutaminase-like putative cysteine protease